MSPVIAFSHALREGTRVMHTQAEGSSFIGELLEGKRDRDDYVALVAQQYFIYEALENVAAQLADDPVAGLVIAPQLTRLPAISADLEFLIGHEWPDSIDPLPATRRYVERILETADWPGGFVAHHYTRYLGDLSGGQVVRTMLQRHFGFQTDGVGFYIFADIAKPKLFKDHYRAQLDTVDWDDAERERVIAEAGLAFRHNADVFADLEEATAVPA